MGAMMKKPGQRTTTNKTKPTLKIKTKTPSGTGEISRTVSTTRNVPMTSPGEVTTSNPGPSTTVKK